jgi:uncharacterized membrane protein
MRFGSSIEINAPVDKVWPLIDRLEEWPQWMPSIETIARVSEGSLAVGSRLSVTVKAAGLRVTLLMTITEFVPEQTVVMQGRALGTSLKRFYRMAPVDGKTKVVIGGDASGVLAWLVCWGGKKVSTEIGEAVKRKVEESERVV